MTRGRIVAITTAAALAGFLIGFAWQYSRARSLDAQVQRTEQSLAFALMEGTLASAAISAQAGAFDLAQQQASEFFTELQVHIGQAPPNAQAELRAILAERDQTVGAVSRRDPGAAEILARHFIRFHTAMRGPM